MADLPTGDTYADRALAEADRFLTWARAEGAGLDGSDKSIWFVQGVLESMHEGGEEGALGNVKCLAFSVYVARLYESSCSNVRMLITDDGEGVDAVLANGVTWVQHTLNWVTQCVDDPNADNIVFKYACGLRDFGEVDRAAALFGELEAYSSQAASRRPRRWGRGFRQRN